MKISVYFMLKALFILETFAFWPWFFGYVEKRLGERATVNFKTYDVTDWTTNNYNTPIAQYIKK